MRLASEEPSRDKGALSCEGMRRDNGLNRPAVKILRAFSHGNKEDHTFLIEISPESVTIFPM